MADESKSKQITVLIANRPYPLKVKDDDEAAIRRIVKEINDKVNKFQLTYTHKDKQDCLAMALLTYAVDLHMQKEQVSPDSLLSEKIDNLEAILSHLAN